MYNLIDYKSALKRICRFCVIIKPERAHHCRLCRKCVLRYDHHCKFLSNCVGFNNYKYFVVYLFYCLVNDLFIMITSIDGFTIYLNLYGWEDPTSKTFAVFYFIFLIMFISIFDLFLFQFDILCKGLTTVENKDKNRKDKEEVRKSCNERMDESLGQGCSTWFCPTSKKYNFKIKSRNLNLEGTCPKI